MQLRPQNPWGLSPSIAATLQQTLQVSEALRRDSHFLCAQSTQLKVRTCALREALKNQTWYQHRLDQAQDRLRDGMAALPEEAKALHARLQQNIEVSPAVDPLDRGLARLLGDEIDDLLQRATRSYQGYSRLRRLRESPPPDISEEQYVESLNTVLDEIRQMLDLIEAHRQKYDQGYALLVRVRGLRDSISRM